MNAEAHRFLLKVIMMDSALHRFLELALLLMFLESSVVFSQEPANAIDAAEDENLAEEFDFLKEFGMVEAATRRRQEIGMSPSAITVITREDIETFGSNRIPDLFRLVPGCQVVKVSPGYTTTSARVSWSMTGAQFRVLVDGRDISLELLGAPLWVAEPISVDDIERIEVIRGPASALYGTNAFTGLINITTRPIPEKTSIFAKVGGGDWGNLTGAARATTKIGKLGISLSTMADHSGFFLEPDSTALTSWTLRSLLNYQFSPEKTLSLDLGLAMTQGIVYTSLGMFDAGAGNRTLRLSYESEPLKLHLYWSWFDVAADYSAPLQYKNIRLAIISPASFRSHVVDSEVQWNLPRFYQPLYFIAGGNARLAWLGSASLLDPIGYVDTESPLYHQPGIDYWDLRAGAYLHGEYAPADWLTIVLGIRYDFNVETTGQIKLSGSIQNRPFLSYQLAAVFRPWKNQFFRLGLGRSYRKPGFSETTIHPSLEYPPDSPIRGTQQQEFQEFISRIIANWDLKNEVLLAFEAGYMGQFLDDRLAVNLDLFYNIESEYIRFVQNFVNNPQGLPDLKNSSFAPMNSGEVHPIGAELAFRYHFSEAISILGSWTHLQVLELPDRNPKNLFSLGGRAITSWGLVSSLYVFSRSEFWDVAVQNPAGLMEPLLTQHLQTAFLLLGKCGFRWRSRENIVLEAGFDLMLPISPHSSNLFRYRETGGGLSSTGSRYGAAELGRLMTLYLQGTY